jgi:hypothetical protein
MAIAAVTRSSAWSDRASSSIRTGSVTSASSSDSRFPQAFAALGQRVGGDARGGGRELDRLDDAGFGQRAQAGAEQVGVDPGQGVAQRPEPLRAEQQLADDQQRPALAEQVERLGEPADLVVAAR